MRKKQIFILQFLISIGLLYFIIQPIGFGVIYENITVIQFSHLAPLLVLSIASIFLFVINLFIFFRTKIALAFPPFFRTCFISQIIADYTPARLGEFSLIIFMKKSNAVSASLSAFFLILNKGINIATWAIIFAITLPMAIRDFNVVLPTLSFTKILPWIMSIFLVFFAVGIVFRKKITPVVKKIALFLREFYLIVLLNIFLTFLRCGVIALISYLIFHFLGASPSFFSVIFTISTFAFFNMIPVAVGGIGIRELVYTSLYPLFGIAASIAIAASLIELALGLVAKMLVLLAYSSRHLYLALFTAKEAKI